MYSSLFFSSLPSFITLKEELITICVLAVLLHCDLYTDQPQTPTLTITN